MAGPSANLDDWQDGPFPDAIGGEAWTNGNLNAQKAHYAEGESVPFRARFDGLVAGNTYTITIRYDTTKAGKHAFDYLTTYNQTLPDARTEANPDPTIGTAFFGQAPTDTFGIPIDPNVTAGPNGVDDLPLGPAGGDDITQVPGVFTMWGGDITAASPYTLAGLYSGDSDTSITLTFTATSTTAVLAWGGHVGNETEWGGPGTGAFNINGSPYHMALDSTTFNVGGQDHQMQSSVIIIPPNPAITLDKTAGAIVDVDGNGPDAGDTVTYSYLVTNAGNVTLSNVNVVDDNGTPGNAADDFTINIPGTLAPGASTTVSSAATVLSQADVDAGSVHDIALATGTPPVGANVTASDDATVTIPANPAITLDKTAGAIVDVDGNGPDAGDTVTYSYLVTNAGNVTLSNVNVVDDNGTPGNAADDFTINIPGTLAPGASTTVSSAATVLSQADVDAGSVHDIALATGTPPVGANVTASDDATVTIPANPAITLDKTAGAIVDVDGNGPDAGDTVTYSYLVTNAGNVTLSNVNVVDDNGTPGNAADDFTINIPGTLAPGASTTVSSAATVLSQADVDAGSVHDIALATGTPPVGANVTASDDATVTIPANPAITLDKTAGAIVDVDGNGPDAGDTVTYSYLVTNASNVTLSNVNVVDDNGTPGNAADDFTINIPGTLAPGASTTVSSAATVLSQADVDAGSVHDIALATGTPPVGANVTASDDATVTIPANPAITLDKTAGAIVDVDGNGPDAGDTVTYSYLVTNASNVTLSNVNVVDDNGTPGNAADDFTINIPGTLAPGASTTVSSAATVLSQADVDAGSVHDIALATGTPPVGANVTASDDATVTIPANPAITLDKTAGAIVDVDGNGPDAGDTVTYSYLVTNAGNVTLSNVNVVDDNGTPGNAADDFTINIPGTLAPGASTTVSSAATVLSQADVDAGSVHDIALATGTPPVGANVTASDDATVTIPANPAITLDKTAGAIVDVDGNGPDAGDTVTYSYLVTNASNVTLSNVNVVDDNGTPGNAADDFTINIPGTLAPGASTTVSSAATVLSQADVDAGSVHDIALATGTPPVGANVTASDDATVTIPANPAITLDKTAGAIVDVDGNGPDAGDTVTYSYLVTNASNVTLSNVNVVDDNGTPGNAADDFTINIPGTLAPGASTTVSSAATVLSQADVDAGSVHDIALATGTPPVGANVTASDDATVTIPANPAITLDKTAGAIVDVDGNGPDAGDTVTYSYLVTNAGNVTLSNVNVVDDNGTPGNAADDFTINIPGTLAPGASTTVSSAATVLSQADVDAGSVHDIALATGTPPVGANVTASDDATVTIPANPAITLDKTAGAIVDVDGNGPDAGDTVTYSYLVTNASNVTLSNVNVVDDNGTPGNAADDFTINIPGTLAPGASTTVSSAATVLSQADVDAGSVHDIALATGTPPVGANVTASDDATVTMQQSPAIDVEKLVSVNGGSTFVDADTAATAPTLLSGTDPVFKFVVTNSGNVTLSNVTLHDDKFDLNGAAAGTDVSIGSLAPGGTFTIGSLTEPFQTGLQTDIATATGTPPAGPANSVTDSDPANYLGLAPPIVTTGTPQFNFPNSVDKIQPKVGGGASFTFNAGGYIYWDFYSSNIFLAQIKLDSGTTEYTGLAVSIVQVWGSNGIGASTGEAIYRVYVTDNTPNTSVSLDNSHLIVSYSIVDGLGQPASATNKNLIDLVNSDPLIGNFNNFNNIENALLKPSNDFRISPVGGLPGVEKDWLSSDTTGTATGETAVTFDALGGNDAVYGRSNTQQGGLVGDTLTGGAANNLVDGRAGNDVIDMSAQTGNNYLYGGLGNDTLKGGSGDDTLVGSYGVDTLTGNGGADIFILQRGGIETITDFTPGTDKLWIGTFNGTATPGATFFGNGLATAPNGTDAVYDPSNGNLYFDPDGTGTGVDPIVVGLLAPGLTITSNDVKIDPMVQAIAGTQLSGNSGGALANVLPTAQEPSLHQHALAGSTG